MRLKKLYMGVLFITSVLTVTACTSGKTADGAESTAPGQESESSNTTPSFGAFTATDLEGNAVTQDLFTEYELTMVNIWATFCGPCLREMPDLGAINTEYSDKSFQVVGIVTDVSDAEGNLDADKVETAKEIVAKTGANYKHLLPSADLIKAKLSSVTAVPETIFVDKDGNQVGESYLGAKSKAEWIEIIDGLLAGE